MATDRSHLIQCTEYLRNAAKYAEGGRSAFQSSRMCQDAILWNLQMACLCAELVSPEERQRHPSVDWHHLRGLAKSLVDADARPDTESAWELVESQVPHLQHQLRLVLTAKM